MSKSLLRPDTAPVDPITRVVDEFRLTFPDLKDVTDVALSQYINDALGVLTPPEPTPTPTPGLSVYAAANGNTRYVLAPNDPSLPLLNQGRTGVFHYSGRLDYECFYQGTFKTVFTTEAEALEWLRGTAAR